MTITRPISMSIVMETVFLTIFSSIFLTMFFEHNIKSVDGLSVGASSKTVILRDENKRRNYR